MSYSMLKITHIRSDLGSSAIEKHIADAIATSPSNVTVVMDDAYSTEDHSITAIIYPDDEHDIDLSMESEAIVSKLNELIAKGATSEWTTSRIDAMCKVVEEEEEEEVSINEEEALKIWREISNEERTLHLNTLPNPDGVMIQPIHNDTSNVEILEQNNTSSPTESQLRRDPTLLEFDNVERIDVGSIHQISWDKPIIITNILSQDFLQSSIFTNKQLLIAKYGDTMVRTGNRETLIDNGFTNSKPMSLSDALDVRNTGSMHKDCGTIVFSPVTELPNDFILELKILCDRFPMESKCAPIDKKFTLTIASEGFGIGFHKHNPAMFMLLNGRKKWYMSSSDDLEGIVETHPGFYKELSSHKCIQQPGEILYVPNEWYHEIFNIDYTIGIQALPDE